MHFDIILLEIETPEFKFKKAPFFANTVCKIEQLYTTSSIFFVQNMRFLSLKKFKFVPVGSVAITSTSIVRESSEKLLGQ